MGRTRAAPCAPTPPPQLSSKEGGLSGDAVIRGAYVNTGSRDVGIDRDAGRYQQRPTPAQQRAQRQAQQQ